MNCVPQGALLALLAAIIHCAMTSPVWMPQFLSGGSGRNIRHLPCVSRRTGETGVCMFAFACMKANGTHLGTCIDRFYFGSCCRISEENVTSAPNTEDNNLFPITTTTESKYYLSTFQSVQDNENRVETEDNQTIKPVKPIILPTKKPSVPEKKTTTSPVTTQKTTTTTRSVPTQTKTTTRTTTTTEKVTKPSTTTSSPLSNSISTTKVTVQTTLKPQTKPTKPSKTTTTRPPTQSTTSRKPATPVSTTKRPTTPTKPTKTTTRKPVTQTKPTQTTTKKPVVQTKPPITTTKRTTVQATYETTTRPVIHKSTTIIPVVYLTNHTTTNPLVTQTKIPETTTRKLNIPDNSETTTPTTPKQTTASIPYIEISTIQPLTPTLLPFTTTRFPITITKPTITTSKRPTESTWKPTSRPKPSLTTKKPVPSEIPTRIPPAIKPKPTTTTKKPAAPTTLKPPTKKPIKTTTTEVPTETTTTVPPSLITWTMVQEPPKTEAATTMTTTSVDWILVPVTTHPPSTDTSSQPGTTTSTYPDTLPDATASATTTTSPETTLTPEVTSSVTNATLDIDLNMTDFRQVCGRRLFPESRIVGGEKSTFGRWPWQISLRQWRTSTYLHKCGAALLNENWAITAAHCVENVPPSDLLLRLGEHDLSSEEEPYGYQERRVQIVASHPQFDPRTFEYDLALLRFYEPVRFQPNILPVCVPQDDTNFVGHTAYVTGWGRLYEEGPLPSVLQEVSVPVINNSVCETMYRSAGYIEHIPEIFICAGWRKGGFDSCEGDSGGPMVIQRPDKRWLLAGVISWGIGCAEPNQPGVYTRISEFREWINQILQF